MLFWLYAIYDEMKQNIIFKQTLLSLSMLLFCGCVENIDIDTGEDLPVVVDCVLKMDTVQTLRLYKVRKMYENKIEPVTNAQVELLGVENNNDNYQKVADFRHVYGYDWVCEFKPDYRAEYKLHIVLDNGKELTATTSFPDDFKLVLQSKRMKDTKGVLDGGKDTIICQMISAQVAVGRMVNLYDIIELYQFPIPGEEYFKRPFKFYQPATRQGCKLWIYPHTDTTMVLPPFNYIWDQFKASEIPFKGSSKPYCSLVATDHPGADNFNLTPGTISDLSIVKVPVNTNIHVHRITHYLSYINYTQWFPLLCADMPLHEGFVRIDHPAGFSNGVAEKDIKDHYQYSPASFVILADYHNYMAGIEPFLIEVHFLSDEYDAFLRDLHVKNMSRDNFILSSYDIDNISSNIEGGVGVFGAEIVTWAQEYYYGDKYEIGSEALML